jgi:hypothetical protein
MLGGESPAACCVRAASHYCEQCLCDVCQIHRPRQAAFEALLAGVALDVRKAISYSTHPAIASLVSHLISIGTPSWLNVRQQSTVCER